MVSKGTQETIVYPHIVFSIDNFEDVSRFCVFPRLGFVGVLSILIVWR